METTWIILLVALIGVIVAIVAIIIPIKLKRKKLMCILFPSLSLVDVRTEVKDKIKIYYNEDLVENLSMTKVKIRNNGNLSIRKEDVIKSLEFDFGEKLSAIDYSVIDTEPEGITVNLESNNEKNNLIRCFFDLLNSGDEFTLQFVCLGESKELPNITARIEGIKQIDVETISVSEEIVEKMRKTGKRFVYLGVISIVIGVILLVLAYATAIAAILISYGIMFIILGILSKVSFWKYPILRKFFVSGTFKK